MTIHTVTVTPPEGTWASFQLEAFVEDAWTAIQAGEVTGSPQAITARFPGDTVSWRVLWVAEGGSINGTAYSPEHDFAALAAGHATGGGFTYRGR